MALLLVGGVSFVLPVSRSLVLEERLRFPLTAVASGLAGYVLFGLGLIPLERVSFITGAIRNWLPYEILPVAASLLFAALGLFLFEIRRSRRI